MKNLTIIITSFIFSLVFTSCSDKPSDQECKVSINYFILGSIKYRIYVDTTYVSNLDRGTKVAELEGLLAGTASTTLPAGHKYYIWSDRDGPQSYDNYVERFTTPIANPSKCVAGEEYSYVDLIK